MSQAAKTIHAARRNGTVASLASPTDSTARQPEGKDVGGAQQEGAVAAGVKVADGQGQALARQRGWEG